MDTVDIYLFPAYAGVILTRHNEDGPQMAFPRLRGGDPRHDVIYSSPYPFSPPTRG